MTQRFVHYPYHAQLQGCLRRTSALGRSQEFVRRICLLTEVCGRIVGWCTKPLLFLRFHGEFRHRSRLTGREVLPTASAVAVLILGRTGSLKAFNVLADGGDVDTLLFVGWLEILHAVGAWDYLCVLEHGQPILVSQQRQLTPTDCGS